MKSKFIDSEMIDPEVYDGSQLVSLRSYLKHGLLGDSIVAWTGACDVSFEHMVDGEDLRVQARIAGDKMLHFIVEKFATNLFAAVALQRLFAGMAKDDLQKLATNQKLAASLFREGDDLYVEDRKLSISIATQSPVSSLIHFALNITNAGTPVKTLSLEDLGVESKAFALGLMKRFCREVETIQEATCKVRAVK